MWMIARGQGAGLSGGLFTNAPRLYVPCLVLPCFGVSVAIGRLGDALLRIQCCGPCMLWGGKGKERMTEGEGEGVQS